VKNFAEVITNLLYSNMDDILYKHTSQGVKALDDNEYIVEAYANVYGNEDSDGDISGLGSFKRTINNNGKRVKVYKDHISTITLGVPMKIDAEDPFGLFTVTKFNKEKEVSRDMYSDLKLLQQHGLTAELSIGYWVMSRDAKNPQVITEYKLMEYSFLSSWGANELTRVTGIKSMTKSANGVIEFLVKMYNLNYSDPRLRNVEKALESLAKDPSDPDTLLSDPIDNKSIIKALNEPLEKWLTNWS
jgi:HK97 family phage prohead protease